MERHVYPWTIVSVNQHYKNSMKRVCLVQSGHYHFALNNSYSILWNNYLRHNYHLIITRLQYLQIILKYVVHSIALPTPGTIFPTVGEITRIKLAYNPKKIYNFLRIKSGMSKISINTFCICCFISPMFFLFGMFLFSGSNCYFIIWSQLLPLFGLWLIIPLIFIFKTKMKYNI